MAQVFVSGTWRDSKAKAFNEEAALLGQALARRGFDLACGPGTGIARYVIDGYRAEEYRGQVRYYLPREEYMTAAGEGVAEGADDIEITDFDYPMRNVYQISKSDGLFILTGGDGTLEEALPALIDYGLPVAVVEEAGSAATALRLLSGVYPEWQERLLFGQHTAQIIETFCDRVTRSADRTKLVT